MTRYFLTLLMTAMVIAAESAYADPTPTTALHVRVLTGDHVLTSTQIQNHTATVVIGPNFFNATFQSQQDICGPILQYFQGSDASIQSFQLVDAQGRLVGMYTPSSLQLVGR